MLFVDLASTWGTLKDVFTPLMTDGKMARLKDVLFQLNAIVGYMHLPLAWIIPKKEGGKRYHLFYGRLSCSTIPYEMEKHPRI